MTKQFCDACGREIFGSNKFNVILSNGENELDICYECKKEFKKERCKADIETFKRLHK